MYFRMVPAVQPAATSCPAIFCAYQTSDIFGRRFFSVRYAARQRSCLACVSSLRASRRAVLGV